jgi:CHAT domain-containing protein
MAKFKNKYILGAFLTLNIVLIACSARAGNLPLADDFTSLLQLGAEYRQQGQVDLAIDTLQSARRLARGENEIAQAAGALGRALLHGYQYERAAVELDIAYQFNVGAARAWFALDLGTVAQFRRQATEAAQYFREAIALAGDDVLLRSTAELSLVSLLPPDAVGEMLRQVSATLASADSGTRRASLQIKLAGQAAIHRELSLAYHNFTAVIETTELQPRLVAEALNGLAQLYEGEGRVADAGHLTERAVVLLNSVEPALSTELLLELEWRKGRLAKQNGQMTIALAAYQRAAEYLERIRQDLPIEYLDGRSSYGTTIAPIYENLLEILLEQSGVQTPAVRTRYLERARDIVELTRQAEMQDYLGDRCVVTSTGNAETGSTTPTDGTAYLYSLQLPESTALLLVTPTGIVHHRVTVDGAQLRELSREFAEQLRYGKPTYIASAQLLYNLLIRPFDTTLAAQQIGNLVVIPDGVLRLVPFGALHDGQRFLIENLAIATATGITMTRLDEPGGQVRALVAGLANPGPVVDKFAQRMLAANSAAPTSSRTSRDLTATHTGIRSAQQGLRALQGTAKDPRAMSEELRLSLALPGVKLEVAAVGEILGATRLLDSEFNLEQFSNEAENGEYRILHIASHGMFGGSADSSFILTYDELLTLNRLQAMLSTDAFRRNPIELITLSACETAEGNARAPLGIAGAAMKARARTVLGTLWPVEDNAARHLMEQFYAGIIVQRSSKVAALRQAQIGMIHSDEFGHPFFWAPFTLIGNWL